MDVSKETKTESRASRGGKVIVGALVVLVGGVWLAFGLTTWGERPLRGLGFTVLALGAAVVAGLLWGRAPEPMARRLRGLAYGLLCAAEERRRRAADWEAYERGYPDRSK